MKARDTGLIRGVTTAGLWLEIKLAFRTLRKHPGISFVSGLSIALAVGIGSALFDFFNDLSSSTLPLDGGDRIVSIVNWDVRRNAQEFRSLHDFVLWRDQLMSVQYVGAYSTSRQNIILADGRSEPIEVAEITPVAFDVARVPAMLGRVLVESDRQDEANAIVLGYAPWQRLFGGDSEIVGKSIRLGLSRRTVVGVMPRGFKFPVDHQFWSPPRHNVLDYERLSGPSIRVFGRLADGYSLEAAQAELSTVGDRVARQFPETNRWLSPRVMPYTEAFSTDIRAGAATVAVLTVFAIMVIIVGLNVATLTFARVVRREEEIATRAALGAGPGRIVALLFVEALVLVSIATTVGVMAAWLGLRRVMNMVTDGGTNAPFWWDFDLAPITLLCAGLAGLICACLITAVPAAKILWRIKTSLQTSASRGGSAKSGVLWSAVVIGQVALSVAVLPRVLMVGVDLVASFRDGGPSIPVEDYLTVRLTRDDPDVWTDSAVAEATLKSAAFQDEVAIRLEREFGADAVTFASHVPGEGHPTVTVEVDLGGDALRTAQVRRGTISPGFFNVLQSSIAAGRGFAISEGTEDPVVVVNLSMAAQVFAQMNPIGQRIREVAEDGEPGEWLRVVGVVPDLGMDPRGGDAAAGFYRSYTAGTLSSVAMIVRVGRSPASFSSRLRATALGVDPTVRLYDPIPLAEVGRQARLGYATYVGVLALIMCCAFGLAGLGMHAITSFIVTCQTREIGIRVALGGSRRHIVESVFKRILAQIGVGVLLGCALGAIGMVNQPGGRGVALLLTAPGVLAAVAIIACGTAVRHALRIEATEALRAEA